MARVSARECGLIPLYSTHGDCPLVTPMAHRYTCVDDSPSIARSAAPTGSSSARLLQIASRMVLRGQLALSGCSPSTEARSPSVPEHVSGSALRGANVSSVRRQHHRRLSSSEPWASFMHRINGSISAPREIPSGRGQAWTTAVPRILSRLSWLAGPSLDDLSAWRSSEIGPWLSTRFGGGWLACHPSDARRPPVGACWQILAPDRLCQLGLAIRRRASGFLPWRNVLVVGASRAHERTPSPSVCRGVRTGGCLPRTDGRAVGLTARLASINVCALQDLFCLSFLIVFLVIFSVL